MSKDESADERAAREKFVAWLREIEAAAAEIVEVGDLLFTRQPANQSSQLMQRP